MKLLLIIVCIIALFVVLSQMGQQGSTSSMHGYYQDMAARAATSVGIPVGYFQKQIWQESKFNPTAVGSNGEYGIAQFEESTAQSLGINRYDAQSSLYGAAKLMASFYRYFGDYAKALAAYNWGSYHVTQAVNKGGAWWEDYIPGTTHQYIVNICGSNVC